MESMNEKKISKNAIVIAAIGVVIAIIAVFAVIAVAHGKAEEKETLTIEKPKLLELKYGVLHEVESIEKTKVNISGVGDVTAVRMIYHDEDGKLKGIDVAYDTACVDEYYYWPTESQLYVCEDSETKMYVYIDGVSVRVSKKLHDEIVALMR